MVRILLCFGARGDPRYAASVRLNGEVRGVPRDPLSRRRGWRCRFGWLPAWALAAAGCLSSPSSGDPSGGGPGDCGTLRSLSDDFDGPLSVWRWSVDGVGTANGSQLVLSAAPDSTSALFSEQAWWLDGDLEIELDPTTIAEDALVEVWLSSNDEERQVVLSLGDGTLSAMVYQPSYNGVRDNVPFDPAMRWWRIGRSDGHFHWATSVDGTRWTEQGEFDAELTGLAGLAITHTARTIASSVAIESLNSGLRNGGPEPLCPLSSFTDDFAVINPRWFIFDDPGCSVAFGERADIAIGQEGACGLASYERFSLAEDQVSVELEEPGDCSLNPSFDVTGEDAGFSFFCGLDGESAWLTAVFSDSVGGTTEIASAPWDGVEFRFLRIRHVSDDSAVVFETSPDGATWEVFGTAGPVDGADVSSVEVSLAGYADSAAGTAIAFDQLNLPADGE